MITRQHYKAIAEIIKETPVDIDTDTTTTVERFRSEISRKLAVYFTNDNPRFDYEKFMAACGLG